MSLICAPGTLGKKDDLTMSVIIECMRNKNHIGLYIYDGKHSHMECGPVSAFNIFQNKERCITCPFFRYFSWYDVK